MVKKLTTNPTTLYDLLQVKANAEQEVIAASAKALLTKHHPDRGGDNDLCARISEAKAILSDDKKRAKYDKSITPNKGDIIGNYRLVRKIAEGGFGEVYEATHTITGMTVCIKKNLTVSSLDTELFLKEAAALWDLRHHALPAVRDMFQLPDGKYAMVMSYIPGPTIEQLLDKYKAKGEEIDPENICWIMERVLDALRYMHYHGVVHGDVKPQNIIIQPEQHTCVLVDFGLASVKPSSGSSADGYTPLFASPESLNNKPLLPESDLYSLGLTMIYAFGGDPATRKVPKNVPRGVRDFIADLLVYDVLSRPHWDNVDLVQQLRDVRMKEFGRSHTNFKKI